MNLGVGRALRTKNWSDGDQYRNEKKRRDSFQEEHLLNRRLRPDSILRPQEQFFAYAARRKD